jgi:sialidase-1
VRNPDRFYGHAIYSDDGGQTWIAGGNTGVDVNECQIAEFPDGHLVLNGRDVTGKGHRLVAISTDRAETWQPVKPDMRLIEPHGCQGSLLNVKASDGKPYTLFANPADPNVRRNLTIRASADEGKTWFRQSQLWTGLSAYSCMAAIDEHTVLMAFEHGNETPYEKISLLRLSLDLLVLSE